MHCFGLCDERWRELEMENNFTVEEKKSYMFKKHLKDHALEYVLDIVGPTVLVVFILYLCKAEEYLIGILFTVFFATIKTVYRIIHYKREYIDVDIK